MTKNLTSLFNFFINFLFFSFVILTLFDPMNKLLNLKVPMFLGCMFACLITLIRNRFRFELPISLIFIILLLLFIPVQSLFYFFVISDDPKNAFFILYKAYLFSVLSIFIYVYRIDALKYITYALNFLAFFIILLTLIVKLFPQYFWILWHFGNDYGIYSIDIRNYGGNLDYFQMYFLTSSLLVISVGFYINKGFSEGFSVMLILLIGMHIVALAIAGSRNNIITSIFLPFAICLQLSDKKKSVFFLFSTIFIIIYLTAKTEISFFFDANEQSNYYKLTALKDYLKFFSSDLQNLFFGQGFGSYFSWTKRADNFVSELTYIELIRRYGIFIGFVLITIISYPLLKTIFIKNYIDRYIFFPYLFYLLMTNTNPLFFSSMGMLFFSAYLASIFLHLKKIKF